MIIDCISDLHGFYPKLEGGDLLIISGDLTAKDLEEEYWYFAEWIANQDYEKIIVIAGNHDNLIQTNSHRFNTKTDTDEVVYLCDSGTEFQGLKIWGSPWTKTFPNINPEAKAFTVDSDEQLAKKWNLIPNDTDILITHCPPYGIFDGVKNEKTKGIEHVGSVSLRNKVLHGTYFKNLKYHVFGHVHEHGGSFIDLITSKFINASYMNDNFQPLNKPVRLFINEWIPRFPMDV